MVDSCNKNWRGIAQRPSTCFGTRLAFEIDACSSSSLDHTYVRVILMMDEIMGKIATLREITLFKELSMDVLFAIANKTQRLKKAADEIIFSQGDLPNGCYFINSGEVFIQSGKNVFATLKEYDFFGEASVLTKQPRAASAIAGKNCVLLFLAEETFNQLFSHYPQVMHAVAHKIIADLQSANAPKQLISETVQELIKFESQISTSNNQDKNITHILQEVLLFKGLEIEALQIVGKECRWKKVVKDEIIFNEGDPPLAVYIIASGSVAIYKNQELIKTLKTYDFFGEAGVLNNQPRLGQAKALEDSLLLFIEKEEFNNLSGIYPEIMAAVVEAVISYLQSIHKEALSEIHEQKKSRLSENLPEFDLQSISALFFDRVGEHSFSNMTILDFHLCLKKNHVYKLTSDGFVEVGLTQDTPHRFLEERPSRDLLPEKYAEIEAIWDARITDFHNNVFGGNGRLIVDLDRVELPVVEATDQNLAYYGAKIVHMEETVALDEDLFPIWIMILGKHYLTDFVMSPRGGGLYVEYHHDAPHFHMPLNTSSGGYYILGKKSKVIDEKTDRAFYHLTAFKIPYGKSVYTCRGMIHCDAGLTGAWIVGYTNTHNFSTVVFRTGGTEMTQIKFLE